MSPIRDCKGKKTFIVIFNFSREKLLVAFELYFRSAFCDENALKFHFCPSPWSLRRIVLIAGRKAVKLFPSKARSYLWGRVSLSRGGMEGRFHIAMLFTVYGFMMHSTIQ